MAGLYRYKPSKPAAVLGIVVGIEMIALVLLRFERSGNGWFLVFWCFAVVAIVALNTWAAFSEKGSLGTLVAAAHHRIRTTRPAKLPGWPLTNPVPVSGEDGGGPHATPIRP